MKTLSNTLAVVSLLLIPATGQPLAAASSVRASSAHVAAIGLGDLSSYKTIAADTLALVNKGDIAGAQRRGTDLETAWDKAEDTMKPNDPARWRVVDKAIDRVLGQLRSPKPQASGCASALADLIGAIDKGGAA